MKIGGIDVIVWVGKCYSRPHWYSKSITYLDFGQGGCIPVKDIIMSKFDLDIW